jgi:predicted RNA binding protein YcfA (HicA-like mRNA interferase family)
MAKNVPAKLLVDFLKSNGFEEVRTRGDHHQYKKEGHPLVVTVAFSNAKDVIKSGVLSKILRNSGLKEEFNKKTNNKSKAKQNKLATNLIL